MPTRESRGRRNGLREQGPDARIGAGLGALAYGIERDHGGTDDLASTRVRQSQVQPRFGVPARLPKHEEHQGRRRPAAPPHRPADPEAMLTEGSGHLRALRVLPVDENLVTAERAGNPGGGAAEEQRHDAKTPRAQSRMRRAPTQRDSHHAPSESCTSSRDNFTPLFEL